MDKIKMILRWYYTIKYLKYIQIYYLIQKRILKSKRKVKIFDVKPFDVHPWVNFTYGETIVSKTYSSKILNLDRNLIFPDDWNSDAEPLLWQFHLHYLEDLKTEFAQINADFYTDLILSWLRSNTDTSRVGWHPYTVSKRSINILKFSLNGITLPDEILNLVTEQVHFIAFNLEQDIQANHLFTNLVALAFWEITSSYKVPLINLIEKIEEQIDEQILDDGMHYERSPMYHNNFLLEVLDLINLLKTRKLLSEDYSNLLKKLLKKVPSMLNAAQLLDFDDKKIACFNDTAVASSIRSAILMQYAEKLGLKIERKKFQGVNILQSSGFVRLDNSNFTVMLNAGNVACDYQPGHTHAESLSFELSGTENMIFQNPGISTYDSSKVRSFERSTISHNTVSVDQRNSSDTWSSFRLGKRANTKLVTYEDTLDAIKVIACHDGFSRFCNKIIHKREILLRQNTVTITDEISGSWEYAESHFYLCPEANIVHSDDGYLLLVNDNRYHLSIEGGSSVVGNCLINLDFHQKFSGQVIKTLFQSNIQRLTLRKLYNENPSVC